MRLSSAGDDAAGGAFFEAALSSEGLPKIWNDGCMVGLEVTDFREVGFRKDELQFALGEHQNAASLSTMRSRRRVAWTQVISSSSLWTRRSPKNVADAELNKLRFEFRQALVSSEGNSPDSVALDAVPLLLTRKSPADLGKPRKAPPESNASWLLFVSAGYGVNVLRCLGDLTHAKRILYN